MWGSRRRSFCWRGIDQLKCCIDTDASVAFFNLETVNPDPLFKYPIMKNDWQFVFLFFCRGSVLSRGLIETESATRGRRAACQRRHCFEADPYLLFFVEHICFQADPYLLFNIFVTFLKFARTHLHSDSNLEVAKVFQAKASMAKS